MGINKVAPGQKLAIPAKDWNHIVDATNDYLGRTQSIGRRNEPEQRDETILVKNNSGADVVQFAVLGIDGVIFTPTDNLVGFKSNPSLKGVTPTADHTDNFVICQEPIKSGKVGVARLSGLSVVQISVTSDTDTTCGADDGDSAKLKSGIGNGVIVYKENTSGTTWGLVRFGGGGYSAELPSRNPRRMDNHRRQVISQALRRSSQRRYW